MALSDLIPDPNAPPPSMDVSRMSGGMPQLGTPLMPLVGLNQRGQQEQGLQNRISSYENPNKPQGFWQNVRHIAATIGNVAGDVVAPSTMALIPGTQLHNQIQHGQNVRELAGLQGEDRDDETQARSAAAAPGENALRTAQTANLTSETNERDNPRPPADAWSIDNTYQGPNGEPVEVNKTTGQARIAPSVHGITRISPTSKGTEHINVMGPDGKTPIIANYNPETGVTTDSTGKPIANPQPYEKPQQINVNAGEASLDREAKQFGATHQKSLDSSNSQLEKIADARSMINGNAEAQGLGIPKVLTALVGGQGTGVRITQAELQAIAHARGIQGDIEGTINKWSGKGALTPQQKQQLTQIMDDVKTRIQQKQAIASSALDTINGASSRQQIIQADKDARQRLSQLEQGSSAPPGADNEVYVGGKLVGHTVGGKYVALGGK